MNMPKTGKHNPIIVLKKGFEFPKINIQCKFIFKGIEFVIINSEEKLDIFYPFAPGKSGMGTKGSYCWIIWGKNGDDERCNASQVHLSTLQVADMLSLFVNNLYFDTNIVETSIFPGSLSSNVNLNYPEEFSGIKIEQEKINVHNSDINTFIKKVNDLNSADYKYFRSAIFLIKEAKKKFYKGEKSGVIVDAVSALESLYLRPNDRNGYFDEPDSRFSSEKNKTKLFKSIFNNNSIYVSFNTDPYAIRSGHLHSGEINFYNGTLPRAHDIYMDFILQCQKVIFDSVNTFLK